MKELNSLADVPQSFVATTWKKYSVFGVRPVTVSSRPTGTKPSPPSCTGVPSKTPVESVPYANE